ncbi:hypothetical protein GGR56DRAFT_686972 [Xylariaceae sp. FL0804]|nr:hypothetical protein GGR56DRAFT_686972 [Xylariaceae sp. FL0804]
MSFSPMSPSRTTSTTTTTTGTTTQGGDSDGDCRPTAAVVGAGIAGLAAAVALRRAGWRVECLERSRFRNEVGAAITIPPNAARVLDRLGFDLEAAEPVPNLQTRWAAANTLECFHRHAYADLADDPTTGHHGAWSLHRVDLHRGLRELATGPGPGPDGGGPPVEIRLGCEAAGVDCDEGVVRLADGSKVRRDLVVIADGAHSRLVNDLLGHKAEVKPTGRSIYRWLVSMDDVLGDDADADLRAQYAGQPPGFLAWVDGGSGVSWISYTCRGGRVLNNAVVHPSAPEDADSGKHDYEHAAWHAPAHRDRVLATLAGFHPAARRVVDLASEDGIRVHRLFKRAPLETFVRGRAVVIGDAAHAMLPTHAAGGSVAIESAAALEVLLPAGIIADNHALDHGHRLLRRRLQLFDALRLPRCNLALLASNEAGSPSGWPAPDENPALEAEIRRFYGGGKPLPRAGARPWSPDLIDLLFRHDAYGAAERALREEEGEGEG